MAGDADKPVAILSRALSVRQLAKRWGVGPQKIRAMIRVGSLRAFDLGMGRQQLRIPPEAVLECERRLAVGNRLPALRRRAKRVDPEIASLLSDV